MYSVTTILGRCTSDIELKQTPNGVPVASFSVAVDRPFSKEKKADFFNVVAWRNTGEFASKYFSKGAPILVQGTMQSRKYTDKQGNERTQWELVADKVSFTGNKQESGSTGGAHVTQRLPNEDDFAEIDDDGGLPF